jgi:glycosyltransferase involved in cell wall biosynthesis
LKITLIISSLSCGGAERVVVLLAEGFIKKGYEVTVVTIYGIERDFYKLPEGASRLALDIAKKSPTLLHALWNNLYRLWVLRQKIQATQPDVVISFMDRINVMTSVALAGKGYPVIVTEHCDPSMISCGVIWEKLRRITYTYIDRVVSVSQGVDSYFAWLPKSKRAVIYNPLAPIKDDEDWLSLPKDADPNKSWIVAMGRLTYQKGFDILLSAFHKVADKDCDWQLLILGEGNMQLDLEKMRAALGLTNKVIFLGSINKPFAILKKAELFVMSSRYEGFGNVLIEAMACGLPVISTDCPSGPSEIIRDGVDGILVPNGDVEALAAAMERLMSDEVERQRLANRATEVTERFSLDKVMGMWEKLVDQVVKEKS